MITQSIFLLQKSSLFNFTKNYCSSKLTENRIAKIINKIVFLIQIELIY